MRNLLGQVAMLKVYTASFDSTDPIVLTETLRALSMAIARALIVYTQVRIPCTDPPEPLQNILSSLNAAAAQTGRLDL